VALANTVASLYVYARLWRAMYLEPAVDATPVAVPARLGWLLTATATPILALFVLGIGPLAEAVHACSRLLQ
jgi:NADH:ubiquinone oxidoreductase subunit 2 (subunit N)